ncbi:protein DMR6-LIKE OXYGENASE 1-like [Malania oleifera]|uniref:protein DMR6-LIKE OXYGENASE 1-like n=1 Tax=Malania oleifera TaxID=397392 RepID=UPI0025AE42CE|nr:protein DMR6-LIKE OXYGENASE 1-like [Malania oleifera]
MAAAAKMLVSDIVSGGISAVPANYVRPISDRPNLQVVHDDSTIPLIDLLPLISTFPDDRDRRRQVIRDIAHACHNYGFFQVKNHGIPETVIDNMLTVAREFFKMPEKERMKCYSEDPLKAMRLSTSFNVKTEKVSNWRDFLRLHCYPLEDYIHEWPSNPPTFREVAAEYSRRVRELAVRLLEGISESLGLEREYIVRAMGGQGQHMALNYYPPCPQPELTYGLPAHADPNAVTVLLQDQVPGLQLLKNGRWIAVHSIPNTFIVNIGDQIQVISNDRYKSALHRAVVNCSQERISIPTFYCPSPDAIIGPAPPLTDGEDHPPAYRSFKYDEYYRKFWNRGLEVETCLDKFRAIAPPPPT